MACKNDERGQEGAWPAHWTLRRAAQVTAGAGIGFALLFLIAYWLLSHVPGPNASLEEIERFYSDPGDRRRILAGLYLMPFAGIAFLWFSVTLRMWISGYGRRVDILFSNIQLVSGIVFIALFFVSAASASVLAASVEFADVPIDPLTARQFPQFGTTLFFVFGVRMAAMYVLATTNIGRIGDLLPRWFTYCGFAVGIFLLLSVTFSRALVLVFPAWMLVLCVILLTRARRVPADAALPSERVTSNK
ncbi:MAG: hypothetical protein ACRDJE_01380 [Dehalococcoidia bacterium]